MDAPPKGSGFGRREKVCGEAGGRRAKLGEKEPAFGLLTGQSLEARQCVFADNSTGPLPEPVCWGQCWPSTARGFGGGHGGVASGILP